MPNGPSLFLQRRSQPAQGPVGTVPRTKRAGSAALEGNEGRAGERERRRWGAAEGTKHHARGQRSLRRGGSPSTPIPAVVERSIHPASPRSRRDTSLGPAGRISRAGLKTGRVKDDSGQRRRATAEKTLERARRGHLTRPPLSARDAVQGGARCMTREQTRAEAWRCFGDDAPPQGPLSGLERSAARPGPWCASSSPPRHGRRRRRGGRSSAVLRSVVVRWCARRLSARSEISSSFPPAILTRCRPS